MKKKFTFLIMAMLFALMIPSAPTWGAEGDTHDFPQSISQLLNNNATIAPISIPDQGYPVKQVNITCRYNKNIDPAVTINIAIGADNSWGTTTVGNNFNGTKQISGTSTPGNITISFTNNCGSGTGKGTFNVTNVQLVEGPAGSTPSITVNPSTITWDNSPINVQLSETISVSQANLTSNITITSTIGNVSPSTITAGEDATDVTFTYTPTSVGDFEGEITFTNGETTATVSVTGSAYDPSQVDTYELFTGDLVEGDYVIYYVGKAMKNTVTSNRLDYSEVSPENNVITNPDATIVWHIAPSGDYWTIFNAAVAKYAAGNGTKNQATLLTDGTDNGSLWTVSGTETHDFTNKKNTSNSVNATLRNNGTYGFACYATGTGGALTLYKKAENKAATPTLTESQIFTTKPFEVTITNNEAGATVYYTTNGDDPTTETTTNFTGASTTININATTTVKAMAVVEGKANSEIASATYTEQKNDPKNQWSAEAYTATIGGENTFPTFSTQSNGAVTYTSSNTNAATIDNTGVITLVAVGTTTITASTTETATYMAGEASYTLTVKEAPLATMDAIFEKATAVGTTATNVEVTFDNWVISGVKNNNAYLTDNNGKGLIIYTSNHGFEVGNILSGTVTCKLQLYNGSAELTNLTAGTSGLTVTPDGSITPVEPSIADLGGVNTGAVITLNNVTYSGSDMFTDGAGNEIKAYKTFMTLPTFIEGCNYNMTGVYIQYNNTKEIAPRDANDIVLIVEAPTFNPEGGDYNAAQTVEITSATTGATIYYTLDDSDPTSTSTLYTEPIEISKNTTIKAIAVKNGVSSEIATAVYNITITTVATPTFEPEDGTYFNESLEVSLACATDDATIVYTTNNWTTQTNYTGSFTITETTTVKAKATKPDMDDSEIAEATFTKRYKVNYVVNGVGSLIEPTYVTPISAIGTLPTPDAENIPTGFDFAGWSDSESSTTTIGETYIVDADVTLYAVFSREEGGTPGSGNYEKVTAQLTDWRGNYLIAYSSTIFADGRKGGTDGLGKQNQKVNPENNLSEDENTVSAQWGDLYHVTLEKIDGSNTYLLKTQDGQYNYQSSNNNGLTSTANKETATQYPITVKFESENEINLALGGNAIGAVFRYNTSGYFRYYKNCGQSPVYFYKKDEGTPGNTKYYTRVQSISGNTEITTVTTADLITVPNGAVLTITGSCTGDPENLIIEDGGQLIVNNAGVQATMKKHIENTPSRDDPARSWYTISSPLAASTEFANVTNLIPNNVTDTDYDLYRFDEKNGMWINSRIYDTDGTTVIENENFKTIDKGVGYIYSNAATTDIAFEGGVNVADVECTLTIGAANGFNLIGNPFMQNITLTDVRKVSADFVDGFYVLTNQDTWGAMIESGPIAPLQGFLVQATTAGNVTIRKPSAPSKGERSEQNTNIEMIVSNSTYRDNAFAMFGEGIGLNKVNHRNAEAPMLYVPQDGEKFAIAFMDENTTVFPLNFKAMTTGKYSISLKATDDINTLVLVDNMTGVETNMLLENSYSFNGSPADSEGRFTVKLSISHSNGQADNEHFVYQNGSELVVNGEGSLQIFDVLGRVVISEEVHGQTVYVGNLSEGAYIVRMTGNEIKTQKIIIR